MRPTLLALGDSISCGEGVGIQLHRADTWVVQLGEALDYDVELLARPGARVHDVHAEQVPVALTRPAALATVLVGLNDVIRRGFDEAAVHAELREIVARLLVVSPTVLLVRLHDPTGLLPLPGRLRRHFQQRVRAINHGIDLAAGPGVHVVDLADVAVLQRRGAWAVDRLHPGPVGHHAIASAATGTLRDAGFDVATPALGPSISYGPSRRAEGRWLVRHGAPWLARHLREVAVPLAATMLRRTR
jgi:lysophospholipase L1-like esterase